MIINPNININTNIKTKFNILNCRNNIIMKIKINIINLIIL